MLDRRRALTGLELVRLARAIDPDARPIGSEPLLGGLDWGTYAIDLETPSGRRSLVVRRHDGPADRAGDVARRLWTVLTCLRDVELPIPRPILFDDGRLLGAPLVVMSRCPGAIRPPPAEPAAWTEGYADVVAAIQRVDPSRLAALPRCPDRRGEVERLVRRSADGRKGPEWQRLLDLLRGHLHPGADAAPVLRHRDLWFGNTLWKGDEVSGILDWSGACVGDPAGDLGYARLDVHLVLGRDAARAFHAAVGDRVGPLPATAWWELLAAADGLAWMEEWVDGYQEVGVELIVPTARDRLGEFIDDAGSRLG